MNHLTTQQLEAGLGEILESPKDRGVVEMIVRRPAVEEREVLEEGVLDLVEGLVGDNWRTRASPRTADGSAHPDMQLNIMNSRVIALLTGDRARWPLAGDQLYIDLDLGEENLPPGTRLSLGGAVIEVTAQPHRGCKKFAARFGVDALKFVNGPSVRNLHLRGINARIVKPGVVRRGDVATKLPTAGERP